MIREERLQSVLPHRSLDEVPEQAPKSGNSDNGPKDKKKGKQLISKHKMDQKIIKKYNQAMRVRRKYFLEF